MLEVWATNEEYPGYEISNLGFIRKVGGDLLYASATHDGTLKVHLRQNGVQVTRSIRRIIAQTFVDRLHENCNTVITLDNDQANCAADNLAWRPRWYAWQYTNQFRRLAPESWGITVQNVYSGAVYTDCISAGKAEGLLFKDVYRSAVTGSLCYPTGARFIAV